MAHHSEPIISSAGNTQNHQHLEQESHSATASGSSLRIAAFSRYVALLVAWTATCGSLFFSEVLHFIPCVLCWYQRILMYPLGVVLAIGILRRDTRLHLNVLPFSIVGAGMSLYHYLLIKTDWFPPPPCVAGIPCTVDYLNWLGFINIPFLALTAFLLINFAMAVSSLLAEQTGDTPPTPDRPVRQAHSLTGSLAVFGVIAAVILAFALAARYV